MTALTTRLSSPRDGGDCDRDDTHDEVSDRAQGRGGERLRGCGEGRFLATRVLVAVWSRVAEFSRSRRDLGDFFSCGEGLLHPSREIEPLESCENTGGRA